MRAFAAARQAQEAALQGRALDLSEYDVLVTIAQGSPDGLRPTDLADRVLLTKSGITRLLDRLADRGLIERRACPTDRRGQLIALTPDGRRLLRRAAPSLLRALALSLSGLSSADLAQLARIAERIQEAAYSRPV